MKNTGKRHYHILLILFFLIAGVFFLYRELGKEDYKPQKILRPLQPEKAYEALPKIAIVIDDLGSNKKTASEIFSMNVRVTLSIIPHETYTEWIAREGHKRKYEIIAHVPMEAKTPHRLGKGGLYLWMTDNEIRNTLKESLNSIPYAKGISNHMGSAFTEDTRAMSVIISILKKENLFFLDSLTTSGSVGFRLAKQQGLQAFKRDMFLDEKEDYDYLKGQWEKAINIAKRKGSVIILAHPKENTINFLKETLPHSEIKVIPLSEL